MGRRHDSMVVCLPSKCVSLSSTHSILLKKKKKQRQHHRLKEGRMRMLEREVRSGCFNTPSIKRPLKHLLWRFNVFVLGILW